MITFLLDATIYQVNNKHVSRTYEIKFQILILFEYTLINETLLYPWKLTSNSKLQDFVHVPKTSVFSSRYLIDL